MRFRYIKIWMVFCVFAWGCGVATREGEFTLTVKINTDQRNMLYLFYQGENDSVRVDSAVYVEGRFVLEGRTPYPRRAMMRLMEGGRGVPTLFEDAVNLTDDALFVFLEGGNITVEADCMLRGGRLGGTPLNEDMQVYTDSVRFYRDWLDGYRERFGKAYRDRDSEAFVGLNEENTMMRGRLLEVEKRYFHDHLGSVVSLDWLARSCNMAREKSKIVPLFEMLEEQVKNSEPGLRYRRLLDSTMSVEPGGPVPDFTAENAVGEKVTLSSFRGQYVLLDFWASWCGPCRRENVNVLKVYNRFLKNGFMVVGYTLDTSKQAWLSAVEKDAMPWVQLSGLGSVKCQADKLFGVTAIPSNFLIDPEGKIVAVDLRGVELEKTLQRVMGEED